ncbi:MAG: DNA mismatch repair protein MutS [Acidobacteria bacterium]|nr:MAG: DNA mismatch repair protein MutS [Acidobacteriota bacterium]
MQDQDLTPMMRQYHAVKQETPDALLLFRLGDFYELFFEDAVTASRELEITLTARNKDRENPVPMCGVPYHAADGYIARLLRKGYKVAICDQMEAPQKGVKLVKREVTRVITPGTVTDTNVLNPGENNFLLAISEQDGQLGCAFLDISTGELRASQFAGNDRWNRLLLDVEHFAPREVLFAEKAKEEMGRFNSGIAKTPMDDWLFDSDYAARILREQFGTATLDGFGLAGKSAAIAASGAMIHYVRQTQKTTLGHITGLSYSESADYLVLDAATIRNLELFEPSNPSSENTKDSLLGVINRTRTGMGARLLRNWLVRPSIATAEIASRLDAVGELASSAVVLEEARSSFDGLFDLERLLSKITVGTAGPRELTALRGSIARLPDIAAVLAKLKSARFVQLNQLLDLLSDLNELLNKAISDNPPFALADGGVIRSGYHLELDELRSLSKNSKTYLASVEARERERTGITSLKVRFNKVFGYYIEISKANLHLVPNDYDRKQTLVGAERFVTPELKQYEEKILTAEEKILEIEKTLFQEIRGRIAEQAKRIRQTASVVSEFDVLAGFAATAQRFGYTRPQISDNDEFVVRKGRHPVIEALADEHRADRFVPNDLFMNDSTDQILIVTGPNMGGKSTFLRQNALLVILAQMGSFVPAQLMRFPIVDRIFTRIGASDNLARGRSTFMVEMTETAIILNSATPKSLIILDEIGRGTATFDGLSLAWAVIEYIQAHLHAKTIFATHYHEITELADLLPGIKNYHVAVKESQNRIIFLRTVEPGAADRSYGIEVAKLAGIPAGVTQRAREILKKHEENEHQLSDNLTVRAGRKPRIVVNQLSLFTALEEELRNALREVDVENITPLEALRVLADLKKKAT